MSAAPPPPPPKRVPPPPAPKPRATPPAPAVGALEDRNDPKRVACRAAPLAVGGYNLHPWLGKGGHPDATDSITIGLGAVRDYRTRPDGVHFAAEFREPGGSWTLISTGHARPYDAGFACGKYEKAHAS